MRAVVTRQRAHKSVAEDPALPPAGSGATPNGAVGRLQAQAAIGSPGAPRRAIDGVPELLAAADDLEVELKIIADALLRVVSCRSLAIYVLADEAGEMPTRLTLLATAGAVHRSGIPDQELPQLAVSVWLSRPTDTFAWISGEGATILPIVYRRRCVGALVVEHGDQGMPEGARLRDLENLVGLAALAIANHRLKAEGRRWIVELQALREVGRVVGIGLSAESVLDGLFEGSADILSYDTASLFVLDEAEGVLRLAASRNIPPEVAQRCQFKIGEGVVGWVMSQDRPATVPDTLKDARFRLAGTGRRKAHSLLVVPLRANGRVIAALSFARHRPNAFTSHDLELAEVIASYAAQALEHARLAKTAAEVESLRQGGELLASISHDIRAPLSLIRIVVELLRHEFPNVGAQQLDLLDKIARASGQLGRIINTVLETSRLEANLIRLQPEPLSLAELAEDVVAALAWKAASKHRLLVEVPTSLEVWADPTQLHRVLSNLVDNAIKYSPEGGDVVIRGWCDEDGIVVSVTDQGIGIEQEHLARVFERFGRASQELAASESFGLGLYICKRIVEAHGGTIRVESCPSRGSTFTVCLPDVPPVGCLQGIGPGSEGLWAHQRT